MVVHAYNPNSEEDEAGGPPVQGHLGLHNEFHQVSATVRDSVWKNKQQQKAKRLMLGSESHRPKLLFPLGRHSS